MSSVKVTVPFVNPKTGVKEMREGVDVGFKPMTPETFFEYELDDGTVLKLRQTLQKVVRSEGEINPETNAPVYVIQAQGNMSVGKKAK